MTEKTDRLPELLCPAGSRASLEAAIEGGADAIYFGGSLFNARINAKNFTAEDMREAISLAHAHGVKCYLTLNTLIYDREMRDCLFAAKEAYEAGVDALIVADLGAASAIREYLPDLPLHASTQASGHSQFAAAELKKLGFSRMVMAREASLDDIRRFTESSDIELEVFVHGALCVCHSGQCLFSSLVGGRSGNRGECAQPCRLPFSVGKKSAYPLSLRDLCLAKYIPELIDAGVASLKIEGRMKSPEYVLAVTEVYRRLLDTRRGATREEIEYLEGVFSRGGFTDGYFKNRINSSMLGVRSEGDKQSTRELAKFEGIKKKVPLKMNAYLHLGEPARLTVTANGKTASVISDEPSEAQNRPMTRADVEKNLSKLGATPYSLESLELSLGENIIMPLSRLNGMRREAIERLSDEPRLAGEIPSASIASEFCRKSAKTARFVLPEQITKSARDYFDIIYLPLERYDARADGVIMPPVIFDGERERVRELLLRAKALGCRHILVGNLGHLSLAREFDFEIHGDFRLNVTNGRAVCALEGLGFSDIIASPEMSLPRLRDLAGNTSAIVYGRIPLMLLEKCVISELGGCRDASNLSKLCRAELCDRAGVRFPVLREGEHRNIIYNGIKTSMSDKADELKRFGISARHFIFSDESAAEVDAVIRAFISGAPIKENCRRI